MARRSGRHCLWSFHVCQPCPHRTSLAKPLLAKTLAPEAFWVVLIANSLGQSQTVRVSPWRCHTVCPVQPRSPEAHPGTSSGSESGPHSRPHEENAPARRSNRPSQGPRTALMPPPRAPASGVWLQPAACSLQPSSPSPSPWCPHVRHIDELAHPATGLSHVATQRAGG
jgi:hypothetical protein